MKYLLFILLCLCSACKQQTKVPNVGTKTLDSTSLSAKKVDTLPKVPTKRTGNPKFYTQKDTVRIAINQYDTFLYTKQEFNDIVDFFPEFYSDSVYHPDSLYNIKHFKHFINAKGEDENISFSSEVGHDSYHVLYGYFLQKKTGIKKYKARRNHLSNIYNDITTIFSRLHHGGTFFSHQRARIFGYVEYSIYRYSKNEDNLQKTIDITNQKKLFLNSLIRTINKLGTTGSKEYRLEVSKIVDKLEVLILDYFYLQEAQQFCRDYYDYDD